MIGAIIYVLGIALAVWCVIDIFKKNWDLPKKLVVAIIVLLTSWIGAVAYYFLRDRL